jgi:hypothetical protein
MSAEITPLFEVERAPIDAVLDAYIADVRKQTNWYREHGFDSDQWAGRLRSIETMALGVARCRPGSIAFVTLLKVVDDKLAELPEPIIEASDDDLEFEGDRVRAWLASLTDTPDEADAG